MTINLVASASRPKLLLDLTEVESTGGLARWKLLHRQQELRCQPLNGHEDERTVEPPVVIGVRVVLGFLERIAAHVRDQWRTQFDIRFAPYTKSLTAVSWNVIFQSS